MGHGDFNRLPHLAQRSFGQLQRPEANHHSSWNCQNQAVNLPFSRPHIKWVRLYIYIYIIIHIHWLVVDLPSEESESQLGRIIPYIMEKIKHVPNHQPVFIYIYIDQINFRATGLRPWSLHSSSRAR